MAEKYTSSSYMAENSFMENFFLHSTSKQQQSNKKQCKLYIFLRLSCHYSLDFSSFPPAWQYKKSFQIRFRLDS